MRPAAEKKKKMWKRRLEPLTLQWSMVSAIESAKEGLPMNFLACHDVDYAQAARRRLARAVALGNKVALFLLKKKWNKWWRVCYSDFMERALLTSRRHAAEILLRHYVTNLTKNALKRLRRQTKLVKRALQQRSASIIQRSFRRRLRSKVKVVEERAVIKKIVSKPVKLPTVANAPQLSSGRTRHRSSSAPPSQHHWRRRIPPKRRRGKSAVTAAPPPAPEKKIVAPVPRRKKKKKAVPIPVVVVVPAEAPQEEEADQLIPVVVLEEDPPAPSPAPPPPQSPEVGLSQLQRRAKERTRRKSSLATSLQRIQRVKVQKAIMAADRAAADDAAATAAAHAERKQMNDASRKIRRSMSRHHRAMCEKRSKAAGLVQSQWRRKAARALYDEKKEEARAAQAKLQEMAAQTIAKYWYAYKGRVVLSERCRDRKLLREALVADAAKRLLRTFRCALSRRAMERRCVARRESAIAEAVCAVRSACASKIESAWRRRRWRNVAELRRRIFEAERAVRSASVARNRSARVIAVAWRLSKARWLEPVRIISRGRIEARKKGERQTRAARIIQRSWRCRADRCRLALRCEARRLGRIVFDEANDRMKAANRIQRRYACYRARCLGRRLRRNRLNREALDAARDAASRRIGHFVRRRLFVRLLEKRFDACKRRLDRERLYRRYVVEAREERNEAERATEGAVETLQLVKLSAWKLGNSGGQNYYYNWVTGESSYERPEGWTPSVGDVWIKNLDERGNVFYFNQLTQESAWFPPCSRCSAEAKRVCFDCGHIHFCKECFEKEHVGLDHEWRGADVEKDKLEKGEKHCIACETKKATLVCKVCRPDAYCAACFATSHAHGRLREHETIPFEVARKGWQQVDGRVDGEPTYYFHVTTGESSHEKPEELMLKDELMEHQKFKEFEKSANEHCAQVDKLQVEIERLQYEKDTTMYTIAKEREAEHAELEELRQVLVRDQEDYHHNRKHLLLKNPIRYYAARMERRRRRRQLYRKMLLLNRQQRGETGGV